MTPREFVESLAGVRLDNTFNPYSDRCPIHDVAGAPQTRRSILLAMLKAATAIELDALWIGRDLGYRGGRRTGLALTDDVHISTHGARWGVRARRATKGQAVAERTAAVIWGVLSSIESHVFLWNVFPLHPHDFGEPFTNRSHNSRERQVGEELLTELIRMLKPRRLVCIGNDAANVAHRLAKNEEVIKVRHPSYGGQTEFLTEVRRVYGVA
jgi:hypothetical protein